MKSVINNMIVFFIFIAMLATPFPALSDSNNGLIARVTRLENQMAQLQYHIVPVGSILPFAGPKKTIPEGWLPCDGEALDGTTDEYKELFEVIDKCWGAGKDDNDDKTNFNLPDLRGQFLRGVSHEANIDPEDDKRTALKPGGNTKNQVGSYQKDSSKHRHQLGRVIGKTNKYNGELQYYNNKGDFQTVLKKQTQKQIDGKKNGANDDFKELTSNTIIYSQYAEPTGNDETRPKNAYVNWIIKYKSASTVFSEESLQR